MTELATISKRGEQAISRYFKAVDKARKSAWGIAEVVHDTVKSATFDDDFGSMTTYADAIGLSKGSISLQTRAYDLLTGNERLSGFKYTAVCSLLPVVSAGADLDAFLDDQGIDETTSVSTIKHNVKDFLAAIEDKGSDTEEETEEQAAEEETEEQDAEDTANNSGNADTYQVPIGTNFVVINGSIFILEDDELEEIKEVLNK